MASIFSNGFGFVKNQSDLQKDTTYKATKTNTCRNVIYTDPATAAM